MAHSQQAARVRGCGRQWPCSWVRQQLQQQQHIGHQPAAAAAAHGSPSSSFPGTFTQPERCVQRRRPPCLLSSRRAGYSVVQGPRTSMVRPHPAVWRLVHGVAVLYVLVLVWLLFQTVGQARQALKVRQARCPRVGCPPPRHALHAGQPPSISLCSAVWRAVCASVYLCVPARSSRALPPDTQQRCCNLPAAVPSTCDVLYYPVL